MKSFSTLIAFLFFMLATSFHVFAESSFRLTSQYVRQVVEPSTFGNVSQAMQDDLAVYLGRIVDADKTGDTKALLMLKLTTTDSPPKRAPLNKILEAMPLTAEMKVKVGRNFLMDLYNLANLVVYMDPQSRATMRKELGGLFIDAEASAKRFVVNAEKAN